VCTERSLNVHIQAWDPLPSVLRELEDTPFRAIFTVRDPRDLVVAVSPKISQRWGGFRASRGGFRASRGGFRASRGGFRASRGGFGARGGGFRASRGGFRAEEGGFRASRGGFRPAYSGPGDI
jgi:hypothetical protein